MVLKKFKRWRHSKGFGVHSPYAFRFVREVLHNSRSYAYYAYSDLDTMMRNTNSPLPRKTARLIFRLLVEFKPSTVNILSEHSYEALRIIVQTACPSAEIVSAGGDLLICDGMAESAPALRHAIFTNSQNPAVAATKAKLQAGHIYKNSTSTIIVAYPHLPLQTFEVKF